MPLALSFLEGPRGRRGRRGRGGRGGRGGQVAGSSRIGAFKAQVGNDARNSKLDIVMI